jgi:signal transduction histidine kinase
MSAELPPSADPELERQVAERTADLNELVAHLLACWDDDRRQLARKLHDTLGSSMTALTMHLALLAQQLPAENSKAQDRAAQMKNLLNNVIHANRELQHRIWNDKLEFLGARTAISECVQLYRDEHPQLSIALSVPEEDGSYTREQGVAMLRTVEQGLDNVLAHAQATSTEVVLDDNGDEVMLTVKDNGKGPDNSAFGDTNCHGLRLLRERARSLGGQLELRALPDGGAALTLSFPRASQPGG